MDITYLLFCENRKDLIQQIFFLREKRFSKTIYNGLKYNNDLFQIYLTKLHSPGFYLEFYTFKRMNERKCGFV